MQTVLAGTRVSLLKSSDSIIRLYCEFIVVCNAITIKTEEELMEPETHGT
jgi:hypothetical protein